MTIVSFETENTLQTELPTPEELQKLIPLTNAHAAFILRSREAVEAILNGWDARHLLILGPCSIHDLASAREYAHRLAKLKKSVEDQFFIVMRTYFEKPRTIVGWKGMLYDPDMDGSYNLAKGIVQTRSLLAELAELGVPAGCELLEINTSPYYSDFLTWGCIGARTCSSPPHRQLAASLSLPIGFKNSMDGNIDQPIHSIMAASSSHVYLGLSSNGHITRVQAEGNSLCHIVLRGGESGSNYHPNAVQLAVDKCQKAHVRDKVVIDCSHGNCGKKTLHQITAFESILHQICAGNSNIVGMMLESHLYAGSQDIFFPLHYGVSITDPCLDWETTEKLILAAHAQLRAQSACMS